MGRRKVSVEYIQKDKKRSTTYEKRKKGLLKKAYELSTLCDVPLCMLIYPPGSNSDPVTYPEKEEEVGAVIHRYVSGSKEENAKRRLNLEQGLALANKNKDKNKIKITPNNSDLLPPPMLPPWQQEKLRNYGGEDLRPTWCPALDGLNRDELLNLASVMDCKLRQVEEKMRSASLYYSANANANYNTANAIIPISACAGPAVDVDHGMKMMIQQWPAAWHSDQTPHFPHTWG